MGSDFNIGGEFSLNKFGQGRPWGSPPPNGRRNDDPFGLGKSSLNKLDLWSIDKSALSQQTTWPSLGPPAGGGLALGGRPPLPQLDWGQAAPTVPGGGVRLRPAAFQLGLPLGGEPTGDEPASGAEWHAANQALRTARRWVAAVEPFTALANVAPLLGDLRGGDYIVSPPGVWDSLVPVYGSGRMALHHLSQAHYGRFIGWGAMAAADALAAGALWRVGARAGVAAKQGVVAAVRADLAANAARNATSDLRYGLQHFTARASGPKIADSARIGGKYGIFTLDRAAGYRPWSFVETLTPFRTPVGVPIPPAAAAAFARPEVSGLFSASRRWLGTHVSPLGAVDLETGRFLEGIIFKNQVFREATVAEYKRQLGHTWLLDYGIDGLQRFVVEALHAKVQGDRYFGTTSDVGDDGDFSGWRGTF